MIIRFKKVKDNLYRGGEPSVKDVENLYNNYNIKKIISLDEEAGLRIKQVCKLLGIEHHILPLNGSVESVFHLFAYDLNDLFLEGGPTFVHCKYGKDRTGFIIALLKCKYFNVTYEDALKEALSMGFGIGVNPKVVELYKKLIKSSCPKTDDNNLNVGEVNDQTNSLPSSFYGMHESVGKSFFSDYYNPLNVQTDTRGTYSRESDPIPPGDGQYHIPQSGTYDNNAGIRGAGPSENVGGFIYS